MTNADREVLEYIGRRGKTPEAIAARFPDFKLERLLRAGFVEFRNIPLQETQDAQGPAGPAFVSYYVLTPRGAKLVGIDPLTLHAA